jgi:hypothetical protein
MRSTMKIMSHVLWGLILAIVAACNADDGSGPGPGTESPAPPEVPAGTITGTWTLQSVNDHPLPSMLWDDQTADGFGAQMYIVSGEIVFRSDSTFSSHEISRLTIEGVGDQVAHSFKDGRWMFYYGNEEVGCFPPDCPWFGDVRLTTSDGAQGTLHFTNGTLASQAMIPGAPGEADITVRKVYQH